MKENKITQAGNSSSAQLQGQPNSRRRILLVDDDVIIRQVSTEMLTQSGYEVDTASDGAAGWEALQANEYDLLITDNFMPKLTGVEMVKLLHVARIAMPVIMATGRIPKEEFGRQPWLKAASMLVKPFSARQLLATVEKALRATPSAA
jgi:DNA-binding response OmpR family regulator